MRRRNAGYRFAMPLPLVEVAELEQHPTAVTVPDAVWVATQEGRLWRLDGRTPRLALDIRSRIVSGGETGLLGLAFHPDHPRDPRLFVNYTYDAGRQLRTRVASFVVRGDVVDPASEVEILSFDQPWSNHNGGPVAFGPDGMLYVGVGDGGSAGDPRGTGQNPADWLGSILRVDVSRAPYAVPSDNPKIPGAAPEVWAWGIRNPWGMHFEGDTLYFADVGQDAWEEVNRGIAGANYGWNVREGNHCFAKDPCRGPYTAPLAEYSHREGNSVTGGVVWRGLYLYADFYNGTVWGVPVQGGPSQLIADTELLPAAFAKDRAGNVYIADYRGTIFRMAQ